MHTNEIRGAVGARLLAAGMSLAMLITVPCFGSGAPAEPQAAKNTMRDPDLDALDAFLDSTPEVSKDVHQNPALLNDQKYIADHPGLAKLLQEHPRVRELARKNPQAVRARNSAGTVEVVTFLPGKSRRSTSFLTNIRRSIVTCARTRSSLRTTPISPSTRNSKPSFKTTRASGSPLRNTRRW